MKITVFLNFVLTSGLHAKDSDATDKGLVACRLVDCLFAPTL